MKDFIIIYGHGGNDPGASGHGINERDFYRKTLDPFLQKWAKLSKRNIHFFTGNAYQTDYLYSVDPDKFEVVELHLDASSSLQSTGGHVIIHGLLKADDIDNRLAAMIKRNFGCRGGVCFSGRTDLKNVNIARSRGVYYRLIELCFVTNPTDVQKLLSNLDNVAKELIESLTGETLVAPVAKPQPPVPAKSGGGVDDWTTKVRKDVVDNKIMSDGDWEKPLTRMELASILYTAKARGYFK